MLETQVRPFAVADTEPVVALWRTCGLLRPWNDPYRDIERKLRVQPDLFLVAEEGGIVGSAMAGYDGHRGHLYYLAVAPERQWRGLGRLMVRAVERLLLDLGCPKLDLQVRAGNEQVERFYARLGYEPDGASGYGRRLIGDD